MRTATQQGRVCLSGYRLLGAAPSHAHAHICFSHADYALQGWSRHCSGVLSSATAASSCPACWAAVLSKPPGYAAESASPAASHSQQPLLQKVAVESQHTVPPWQVWPWLHTLLPHVLWPGCRHTFPEQVLPEGQQVPAQQQWWQQHGRVRTCWGCSCTVASNAVWATYSSWLFNWTVAPHILLVSAAESMQRTAAAGSAATHLHRSWLQGRSTQRRPRTAVGSGILWSRRLCCQKERRTVPAGMCWSRHSTSLRSSPGRQNAAWLCQHPAARLAVCICLHAMLLRLPMSLVHLQSQSSGPSVSAQHAARHLYRCARVLMPSVEECTHIYKQTWLHAYSWGYTHMYSSAASPQHCAKAAAAHLACRAAHARGTRLRGVAHSGAAGC